MGNLNVHDLANELTAQATEGKSGRAARTLFGGHANTLRQTLIVLEAGNQLHEHESPGEATLLVLEGQVRIGSSAESVEGQKGDLLLIPPTRHNLAAVTDAVVILTVAVK